MRRIISFLLLFLCVIGVVGAFPDTISGVGYLEPNGTHITLLTPEGYVISGGYAGTYSLVNVDVTTGAFTTLVDISTGPQDFCPCCGGAELTSTLSGTLPALPFFEDPFGWIIPEQTFIVHGTADIMYQYYDYFSEGETYHFGHYPDFPVKFSFETGGMALGPPSAPAYGFVINATFPDPVPEPSSLLLLGGGGIVLLSKLMSGHKLI